MRGAASRPTPVSQNRSSNHGGRLRLQTSTPASAIGAFLAEHDLFGKTVSTFRDHALMPLEVLHRALVLLGGGADPAAVSLNVSRRGTWRGHGRCCAPMPSSACGQPRRVHQRRTTP